MFKTCSFRIVVALRFVLYCMMSPFPKAGMPSQMHLTVRGHAYIYMCVCVCVCVRVCVCVCVYLERKPMLDI